MADTVLQPAPRGGRDGRVCQAPPVEPGALLSQPASALSWPSTWRGTASGGEAPRKSLLPESLSGTCPLFSTWIFHFVV